MAARRNFGPITKTTLCALYLFACCLFACYLFGPREFPQKGAGLKKAVNN
jgi:hypothetical protein